MFNLFRKKNKKEIENTKNFKEAIKTIKFFIDILEWEKAEKALEEIKKKEDLSYNMVIDKLNKKIEHKKENESEKKYDDRILVINNEKKELTRLFHMKNKEINLIKKIYEKKKQKYDIKRNKERFKIRFNQIKQNIKWLVWSHNYTQALDLLGQFLKENKWNTLVINFYNKEKKKIQKEIEKFQKSEREKLKQNAKIEAEALIWKKIKTVNKKEYTKKDNKDIINILKEKFNFYKKVREKIKRKKLLDEITLLIEEESKIKQDIAKQKLANIHKWLIKEISKDKIIWYDFYWKILWADKISGDTFAFVENKDKYNFFIWDATWHWIRAWFIVTLLSRLFNDNIYKKSFLETIFEINNWLKQDLKNRNFITAIFFEINKNNLWKINFIWMWHEPILIYREKTKKVEKVIPGWLAAWIRIIKNPKDIKVKEIKLEDGDILLTYSDWIAEAKSYNNKFYWIDWIIESFNRIAFSERNIKKIYDLLIEDVKLFRSWSSFDDDVTLLLLKRNSDKDIIDENSEYLQKISVKERLDKKELKKLEWKSKKEIETELEKIKNEKKLKNIIKTLDTLYYNWEFLELKQQSIRFIKDWFIDPKINNYLKKAIANEQKYKIRQKEKRVKDKYNVLKKLLEKWDYETVIRESEDIILKDWNI